MRWLKPRSTQSPDPSQSEGKAHVVNNHENTSHEKDKDEENGHESGNDDSHQYPGLKVVIPTTLSVLLAVFLASLVSVSDRLLCRRMLCLTASVRTGPLLALPFPPFRTISTPLTIYPGMSPRISSPMPPFSCQWARST